MRAAGARRWRYVVCTPTNLQEADAIQLVVDAIESGIFNDLGSGSNVDVCVIREKSTEMLRNYRMPNERAQKEQSYKFPRGTTKFTKEEIRSMVVKESSYYND